MIRTITHKNAKTGKAEKINQRSLTRDDWGFSFFVDSELEAYKAAYQYQDRTTEVEYAPNAEEWIVTVFS